MAIDLLCGQCQGHLLAEEPGSVVACPHCGAHLQVPDNTAEDDSSAAALTSTAGAASFSTGIVPHASMAELPSHSSIRVLPLLSAAPEPSASIRPSAPSTEPLPAVHVSDPAPIATVPRFWLVIAVSYASAVTLAFLFLLMTLGRIKTHPLESLPDVVPKIQNGEVGLEVAPPEAAVARGHVLPLGGSERFGSLHVSPLRVTQGPLRFEHVLNDPTAIRPPSDPVLKLWLKFENVSRNQTFSPLDSLLLFKRHYQDFSRAALTNQFLCQAAERQSGGDLQYLFAISSHSEFRIAGQNLGAILPPGHSVEMFIPSEEGIDRLTGELVWRVQFRKGYHPRTRHGVTTLIDVPFHRKDVQIEM